MSDILTQLEALLQSKKNDDPEKSYTAQLLQAGLPKITKKVGEEATETIIAALVQSKQECTGEIADLIYHLSVMMILKDISWQDVTSVLQKRMNMSGLEEKAARKATSK